jgi:hypothetical protein
VGCPGVRRRRYTAGALIGFSRLRIPGRPMILEGLNVLYFPIFRVPEYSELSIRIDVRGL